MSAPLGAQRALEAQRAGARPDLPDVGRGDPASDSGLDDERPAARVNLQGRLRA